MATPHERTEETTLNDEKKKQACETMDKSSFCVEGFAFTKVSGLPPWMGKSLKETALLMLTLTALKRLYGFVGILYTDRVILLYRNQKRAERL